MSHPSGYPGGYPGYPGYPQPPAAPPSPAIGPSMRVDLVQGTPFGVAYPLIQSNPSGPSIGSLVAGIASMLVALVVACLGLTGAQDGWGPVAGGAFTALSVFLGLGAVGLGSFGLRQIRLAGRGVTGRGMAITGIVIGAVGVGFAVLSLLIAFLLAAG